MPLDRRRVLVAYVLLVVGLLLAFVVADAIPNVPTPPACTTANCDAADVSALVGLVLVIAGIVALTVALFRTGAGSPASPPEGWNDPYSFSPAPPGAARPPEGAPSPPGVTLPTGTATPTLTRCPGCGAPVTAQYGFCPRCGRTLSP